MKLTRFVFYAIALFLMNFGIVSCNNNDDEPTYGDDYTKFPNYNLYRDIYESLMGTSWKLVDTTTAKKEYIGETITFTDEIWDNTPVLGSSCFDGWGYWFISDEGTLCFTTLTSKSNATVIQEAKFTSEMGLDSEIVTLNSSRLVLRYYYDSTDRYGYIEYVSVPYKGVPAPYENSSSGNSGSSGNSNGNGGGNSGSSYEKPEIGIEGFTCTQTSITVKYRIYNQDQAKVSSAKGYYGTSSPSNSVSATVAGSLITIRISGLKKGTDYYVKCTATGPGGSTTSETTHIITNY